MYVNDVNDVNEGRVAAACGRARRWVEVQLAAAGRLTRAFEEAMLSAKPSLRDLGPEYRDGTQLGVWARATFSRDAFLGEGARGLFAKEGEESRLVTLDADPAAQFKREAESGWSLVTVTPPTTRPLPTLSGLTRAYVSFKPEKAVLDETVTATFSKADVGDVSVCVTAEDAGDLVLYQAFVGCCNCLPGAPQVASGISGQSLSQACVGNAVDWPAVASGVDLVVGFAVKPSVMQRATPPAGFTARDLVAVQVEARLSLFGGRLR